jgi:hypothetical protein
MLSLARIALAIQIMAPQLSTPVVQHYARAVEHEARTRKLDPLLIVAISAHESRFRAGLKYTAEGELYVGLGQVRARNYRECQESIESEACKQRIASLQDGGTNLVHAAITLSNSRRFCAKKLRRAPTVAEYLSLYQGYGGRPEVGGGYCLRTSKGKRAPMPKLTRRVLRMRDCLYREVHRRKPRSLVCYPH